MRDWRTVLLGAFMAVLFSSILLGSILLSLVESGYSVALVVSLTATATSTPIRTQFIIPGMPTHTLTATSSITDTPTPTFIPPSTCPPPPGWVAIVIQPDDTLSALASKYEVDENVLAYGNCLESGVTTLQPGMVFYVPMTLPSPTPSPLPPPTLTKPTIHCGPPLGWVVYIVRHGDTLSNLSVKLNVSVYQLQLANCLGSSTLIKVGQPLFVPRLPPVSPSLPPPPPSPPSPITPIYTYVSPPTYTLTPSSSNTPTLTFTCTSTPTNTPPPYPYPYFSH